MEGESHQHRSGITLVEVVVVIIVIGLLIALTFPATEAARESARRAACLNNLKQLGLAFQSFHSAKQHFPAASIVKLDAEGNVISLDGWSWCVALLPYLEGKAIYDSLDIEGGMPLEPNADGTASHAEALGYIITELHCPSFSGTEHVNLSTQTEAITNYKALGATHMESLNVVSPNPTVPRYAADSDTHPDGVIYPGSRHGIDDIPDGSSRTALLVESVEQNVARWTVGSETCLVALPPSVAFTSPNDSVPYWHPTGYTADNFWSHTTIPVENNQTYLNWDYDAIPYDDGGISTPSAAATGPIKYGPSSDHAGLVNHVFADGSVHSIATQIDAALYMFIVTRAGSDPTPSAEEQ